MTSQTRSVPPLSMRAEIVPGSLNEEARTVDIIWTTGARVLRRSFWDGDFYEELSLDPKHVRMGRLESGRAPYLRAHNQWNPDEHVGVITSAKLEKGRGTATVRILKDDKTADKEWNRIRQGILTSFSVGYRVYKFEKVEGGEGEAPVFRAVDWEPHEVSGVAIPADAGAHTRSTGDLNPCQFIISRGEAPQKEQHVENENNAVKAERERITNITRLVRTARLDDGFARTLIDNGTSLDAARTAVLDELANRSDNDGTSQAPSGAPGMYRVDGHSDADNRVRDMAGALAQRLGAREQPTQNAQQYARLGLTDMARLLLEARGVSTRLMSRGQILSRGMHTTSDFKTLLVETGRRVLLDGYNAYPGGIRQISRPSSAVDFRPKYSLRLGEAPELLKVGEHGEVKSGTMASSAANYKLETYSRIFSCTRQAMQNDDLGAFDLIRAFGRSAAELEAKLLAMLVTSSPTLADGLPLFHANRGNLSSTSDKISVASLGAGLAAMRMQRGLDKKTPLNILPKFLVVPAALEVDALQHVATLNAARASDVNPFNTRLEAVVDPRLDEVSKTAWYLSSDPTVTPTLEHSFLDGQDGPDITERVGWEVEGMEWKCTLDFGCGIIGPEGLYKNPGA